MENNRIFHITDINYGQILLHEYNLAWAYHLFILMLHMLGDFCDEDE